MYYKLEKGNETFEKLDNVWERMIECNKKAYALCKELGFTKMGRSNNGVAGGISCFQADQKPEGFKTLKGYNLYFPKKNNKEVLNKIDELPIIEHKEYNETIGFKSQFSTSFHHSSFGSKKVNDIYLIEVSEECKYTPTKDMVEITITEYKKLEQ